MALAETAQLIVTLDAKGNFQTEMRKGATALKGFSTAAGKTDKQMTGLRGKLRSPELRNGILQGVGLSGGLIGFQLLGTAISGAVSIIGDSISAASDLAESQAKVDQVFTESSDTIRRWASTSAQSFGLSEQAALEAAGTFGNFIQALGNTEDQANDMSQGLVELAADLASFNNQSIDEVLIALRSGLAGEAEPLRRLGVSISAARVEALLLAEGVEKVNGVFTDADKVAARYKIIMQDTTKAQGDFARTSDGLANKQRILDAQLQNLSATLGGIVVGPATDFVGFLVDVLDTTPKVSDRISLVTRRMEELRVTADATGAAGEDVVEQWQPLTEMDIPAFARTGIYRETGKELITVANRLKLTRQELEDAIFLNDDYTGSLDDLVGQLDDLYYAYDPLSSITVKVADGQQQLADGVMETTEAIGGGRGLNDVLTDTVASLFDASDAALEGTLAWRKMANETYAARKALQSFRDAADQIAETRNIQKVNAALAKQRRLRGEAAREGNVRAFAAAQARLEELKAERRLIRQGRRALKAFQERKKQEAQSERTTARQANNAQRSRRKSIDDTIAKLEELGNTKANPRVTIAGIAAAQAQLTTLRETLAALRSEAGVTYDPVTGQVRSSVPGRASGGPVSAGRAYIVGEHRPEVFVPSENGRIVPNVGSVGAGGVEVYVTPYLTVAASQVEGHTSKVIRTQRFREKN